MPFTPAGAKPSPAVKFEALNAVTISTTTVRIGIAIFHQTTVVLLSLSRRTPHRLISVKISISTAATAYPGPVRTAWAGEGGTRWTPTGSLTHLSPYWSAASVSTGARVTEPSQYTHPIPKPTRLPKA